MVTDVDRVLAQIDKEELADLAITVGNIDSPPGQERQMGEFVETWFQREGFKTKVLSLMPERPNVVGTLNGSGGGYSLLFNSHMDTGPSEHDVWMRRDPLRPIDHQAWREGDVLRGYSVVNDKGPMTCFLIAAKAIKKAGITLKGDLLLTAVSGEIEWEPVDEFRAPQWLSHEFGARFIVTHGAIADYALVAEGTNFCLTWLEAGKAIFKVTVFGDSPGLYSPYLKRPYDPEKNPNAILRMTRLIDRIEDWALQYEGKYRYECAGGTLIPKVNIGAIRGGAPYNPGRTPELCSIYVDMRTAPGQDILVIKTELEELVQSLGLEGEVDLFTSLPGYEAQNIERLAQAIERAHNKLFDNKLQPVVGPECSMWRDINVFNEVGIPAATYGPAAGAGEGNYYVHLDNLYRAAQVYAMVALDLCNQEKVV